jgi:hypothetical protein
VKALSVARALSAVSVNSPVPATAPSRLQLKPYAIPMQTCTRLFITQPIRSKLSLLEKWLRADVAATMWTIEVRFVHALPTK